MTVIAMSRTEIDRMHVLREMAAGRITVNEAAQLTRLTRRHVFRLAKAYRERGPSALVSTRRGQHGCRNSASRPCGRSPITLSGVVNSFSREARWRWRGTRRGPRQHPWILGWPGPKGRGGRCRLISRLERAWDQQGGARAIRPRWRSCRADEQEVGMHRT